MGPAGRRRRAAQVLRHLCRRVRRLRGGQAAGGVLRGLRRRRLFGAGGHHRRAARAPGCWCSPTPSAATSARPWPPTPRRGAGDSPLAVDAVTASPYLGFGSLQPLLDSAAAHGRGVFVLAATSNPEGASVQRAQTDGRTVAQSIVDAAAAVNAASPEPGSVGVVVGATLSTPPDVSALGGPVLVPGVGAQGGRPDALRGFGGARPGQLLPAVSREMLRAGPDVGGAARGGRADARCGGLSGHPADAQRMRTVRLPAQRAIAESLRCPRC